MHLAQAIVAEAAADRRRSGKRYFMSSWPRPTALTFFLGQRARGFGELILYEFAFDTNVPGAYTASIRLPAPKPGAAAPVLMETR